MTNPWLTLPVLVIHFPKLDKLIGKHWVERNRAKRNGTEWGRGEQSTKGRMGVIGRKAISRAGQGSIVWMKARVNVWACIEGACMGVESMHHVFGARVVWLDVRLNLHLPYAIFIREGVKSDSMESWWGWASKVWTWTQPTQREAVKLGEFEGEHTLGVVASMLDVLEEGAQTWQMMRTWLQGPKIDDGEDTGVDNLNTALVAQAWGPGWVDEECVVMADKEDMVPEAVDDGKDLVKTL
ncbi:hypothetical protein DFH94DRAFT_678045 [Russula ochroleuca]|uniref:Uncharacterized protein n=1 Tax=Russula ochroleuca TaxID=152965 RepID=A0A9P5N5J7_9AGAM|nr:hypothetical protein DFH94DRAFT_678045 [Russula ochroleuca]